MEPSENPEGRQRGACVSLMITAMVVGFLALLLTVATGGWAFYIIGIGTAIFLFGTIHYLLWGRMMLQQTAGDREEEPEEEPPAPGSNGITRRGAGL